MVNNKTSELRDCGHQQYMEYTDTNSLENTEIPEQ